MQAFSRTINFYGQENFNKIQNATVMVVGVGGVGGFVVEGLVRSGVKNFCIVDNDVVSESNLNRQIIATVDSVGKLKTDLIKERILSINPQANVKVFNTFVLPENVLDLDFTGVDVLVDAIDTVAGKIALIERAKELNVKVISSMGTGGKKDILSLKRAKVEDTSNCPLARVMRRELKKRNIENIDVIYSTEKSIVIDSDGKREKAPLGGRASQGGDRCDGCRAQMEPYSMQRL